MKTFVFDVVDILNALHDALLAGAASAAVVLLAVPVMATKIVKAATANDRRNDIVSPWEGCVPGSSKSDPAAQTACDQDDPLPTAGPLVGDQPGIFYNRSLSDRGLITGDRRFHL